jgi:hypothetical protein
MHTVCHLCSYTCMQKRVQRLSSGIQECQVLKLKIEHLSECGAGDAQIDNNLHQTSVVNCEGMHEVYVWVF